MYSRTFAVERFCTRLPSEVLIAGPLLVTGLGSASPSSLLSHVTVYMEWCDKTNLSNLLLPQKCGTIKSLQPDWRSSGANDDSSGAGGNI